jgi:hypothetical protein
MSMSTQIPAETIEAIALMREAGSTYRAIADATGLPVSTCEYHTIRLGAVSPRGLRRQKAPAAHTRSGSAVRAFTDAEDAQITAWSIANVPLIEMGRRLNRKHNSILNRLRTLARREAMQEANHG